MRWAVLLQTFNFTVEHRKGKIHSNVDALSRPVLSAIAYDDQEQFDDTSVKSLDPHDDLNLMNFLKFGRHIPGSSKKHCKRVSKMARFFKIDGDFLKYVLKHKF